MPASGNFLFVTWYGGGNINPLVELGRRLLTREHHVRVLSTEDLRGRLESEGLSFRLRQAPEVWSAAADQRAAYLRAFADEVIEEARRERTDALLVDYMQPEALCAAERSGLPHAAFVHTLYTGVAVGAFTPMNMAADVALINEVRDGLGLDQLAQIPDLLDRASTVLVSSVIEFDGAREAPDNVRFTGPLVEDAGADAAWTPPARGSAAPLVVVGLGTTPMAEAPVCSACSTRSQPPACVSSQRRACTSTRQAFMYLRTRPSQATCGTRPCFRTRISSSPTPD